MNKNCSCRTILVPFWKTAVFRSRKLSKQRLTSALRRISESLTNHIFRRGVHARRSLYYYLYIFTEFYSTNFNSINTMNATCLASSLFLISQILINWWHAACEEWGKGKQDSRLVPVEHTLISYQFNISSLLRYCLSLNLIFITFCSLCLQFLYPFLAIVAILSFSILTKLPIPVLYYPVSLPFPIVFSFPLF